LDAPPPASPELFSILTHRYLGLLLSLQSKKNVIIIEFSQIIINKVRFSKYKIYKKNPILMGHANER
jgi:hypothetical protein